MNVLNPVGRTEARNPLRDGLRLWNPWMTGPRTAPNDVRTCGCRARGFSLIQLMMVLVVLASLATVAVQSTSKSINQPKAEATQQLFSDIRASIAGLPPSPPARITARTSSFVADMGRLPRTRQVLTTSGTWLTLDELLTRGGLLSFTNYVSDESNTVLYWDPSSAIGGHSARNRGNSANVLYVPCGWRGPYIYTPVEQPLLVDGWGKILRGNASGTDAAVTFFQYGYQGVPEFGYSVAITNRAEIAGISLKGGAGVGSTLSASDDVYLAPRTVLISSNEITADIRVAVKVFELESAPGTMPPKNNWYVDVRIFGPNPDSDVQTNKPVRCFIKRVDYDSTNIVVSTTRIPVGPKLVIAEIVNNGGNTPGGLRYVAYPIMVNIVAGANNFGSTGLGIY